MALAMANVFERERPVLPNTLLLALFVIFTEMMVFAGLISAFIVVGSQVAPWPPVGQPRLPLNLSFLNTLILVGSGLAAWRAFFKMRSHHENGFRVMAKVSLALGASFLMLQGFEWVRLMHFGFSMGLNLFTAFFYFIIGFHALHAVVGLGFLAYGCWRRQHFEGVLYFWTFVVVLWPILFKLVYGA